MVEIRRGSEAYGSAGGERLPWLEPVEDEDGVDYGAGDGSGGGYGGVLLAAIAVLIGIAVLTAVVVWWRHHRAATADIGQIIHAPAEPYKVKPADPGGMKPDKNGEVTYGTSAGDDMDSPIDLSAMPEQPIAKAPAPAPAPAAASAPQAGPQTPPPGAIKPAPVVTPPPPAAIKPAPVPAKPPVVRAPAPAKPAAVVKPDDAVTIAGDTPTASGPSGTIQLGAFSTEAKASAVWKTMAQRFAYLRGLEKAVVPVESDGKTLYRLRASGPGASGFCARLRIAGETCSGVGG